mmetsp:Transcript_2791/g.8214  ORF Transcript_2791/g.8214 Transcript_2791/m.8214 type:complete len:203 (-) Transcript_2791:495-1103(-)
MPSCGSSSAGKIACPSNASDLSWSRCSCRRHASAQRIPASAAAPASRPSRACRRSAARRALCSWYCSWRSRTSNGAPHLEPPVPGAGRSWGGVEAALESAAQGVSGPARPGAGGPRPRAAHPRSGSRAGGRFAWQTDGLGPSSSARQASGPRVGDAGCRVAPGSSGVPKTLSSGEPQSDDRPAGVSGVCSTLGCCCLGCRVL